MRDVMQTSKSKRTRRVRAKISGTPERPRLTVFRSNKHIYAQIINDDKGTTLVSAGEKEGVGAKSQQSRKSGKKTDNKMTKTEVARNVGEILGQKAKRKGITKVAFDRGPYRYHGRIKALAESVRKQGVEF